MNDKPEETTPWRDPIVEEVRAAREALLASCNFDLDELVRRLREQPDLERPEAGAGAGGDAERTW